MQFSVPLTKAIKSSLDFPDSEMIRCCLHVAGYYTQTDKVLAPSGEVEGNLCIGSALSLLL